LTAIGANCSSQLRHKLEADPTNPRFLRTEVGVGYRLLAE
jgi:two-component system KDP operon response regulator KdpE